MGFFGPSLLLLPIFLLLCTSAPSRTDAWGQEGHKLICKIAESRLLPDARAAVNMLLEGRKLEELCSWADEREAKCRYPQSATLHFVNIQGATCDFNYQRDCGNDQCVVAAIIDKERDLRSRYGRVTPDSKLNESLLFLAHFMGDIHQPLHVGFARDRGGNTIKVSWKPGPSRMRTLHSVWDTQIIRVALRLYYSDKLDVMFQNIEQSIVARPIASLGPHEYASESITEACDYAYTSVTGEFIQSGSHLNDEYASCRLPLVKRRIAQAGVRLADLLNDIFRRRRNDSGPEIE